jgi:L-malate glycosyltransferase
MRLLFFSPYCGRTGSELALYHLIRAANNTAVKKAVACGAGGGISNAFPSEVSGYRYWHALSFADQAFEKGSLGLGLANRVFNGHIRFIHNRVRPDAWYINTIVQPKVLALARKLDVPCILHTHEFEFALSVLKSEDIENMISYPKLIIAASQCAADVFHTLGRQQNIEICHEPIVLSQIKSDAERSAAIRRSLGIPDGAFVWSMSGTRDPRKDPLTFARVAASLLKKAAETYFLWIGGADTGYSSYAKALAGELGIQDRVIWVPPRTDDYFDYLNVADGFVLTSLDDTFPIVMLEAAALGKPIVSFNSGGAREFIKNGMGAVINSWNVEDMVEAMLKVMRREMFLNTEVSKTRAGEFDISVIVKKWESILQKCLGK